ncbi:glycoside hydrolase family 10 protein [Streptomyces sp. NPDC060198]|uniref:glycoside hydrolase family 10 protein n=1 Tax=Streptomyces sp. NPDC060198 TaxID=3347070 RepID=UPI0036513406
MRRMGRRAFMLGAAGVVAALAAPGSAGAAGPGARDRRHRAATGLRGMWIATVANVDWPSATGLSAATQRSELTAHLDRAVRFGLNAVIFQVRPSADALWPSPHEPWSQYLTGTQGKDPGWDPLGTAVAEAHDRGLELHAWFNPYRVSNQTDPKKLVATHPARVHPDWVVPYGGKLYYDPGLPEVRAFVQDAMLDAVSRYDIDAVHWDDYFYPYPVSGQTFDDADTYAAHGGGFSSKAAWRRDNIDRLVKETSDRIKEIKPHVRFGISPFGVWRNRTTDPLGSPTAAGVQTYDDLYADTRKWIKQGWIDYICPQLYWSIGQSGADYAQLVPWWAEVVDGTDVDLYIGEALYKAGDPAQNSAWQSTAELSRHLTLAEDYPAVGGHAFFSAKSVKADPIGAMSRVAADHYGVG